MKPKLIIEMSVESSTENFENFYCCLVSTYNIFMAPRLHILDAEGHSEITLLLNMHNISLKIWQLDKIISSAI
jgi:hypothetical protein